MARNNTRSDIFKVKSVTEAKHIAQEFLKEIDLEKVISFGLPEVDDRFNIWRVPLLKDDSEKIGEVVIDALTTLIDDSKTTEKELLERRLLGRNGTKKRKKSNNDIPKISNLRNTIGLGDSEKLLKEMEIEKALEIA